MRLHCLVMAHHQPGRLGDLLSALDGPDIRVVVHVDSKVGAAPFLHAAEALGSTEFISDRRRVDVRWGGWSQVEATLRMLRLVAPDLERDDYVCLLSGDSYPLQEQSEIVSFLRESAPAQFISGVPMPSAEFGKPMTRISRLRVEYDPRGGRQLVPRAINRLGIPLNHRRALGGRLPYAGSQWWCLGAATVRWVLGEVERDLRFVRFSRLTAIPDEFFFQTLVFSSPHRNQVRPALMFADWRRTSGPLPAVIDLDHIAALRARRLRVQQDDGEGVALFARKVLHDEVAERIRRDLWALGPR